MNPNNNWINVGLTSQGVLLNNNALRKHLTKNCTNVKLFLHSSFQQLQHGMNLNNLAEGKMNLNVGKHIL